MNRARNPERCECYFRNMRALGFVFEVDVIAGTVRTLIDGQPADPVIEVETQKRSWWLLENPEHGVVATATDDELLILAPDLVR
jgi:hypothetical protein